MIESTGFGFEGISTNAKIDNVANNAAAFAKAGFGLYNSAFNMFTEPTSPPSSDPASYYPFANSNNQNMTGYVGGYPGFFNPSYGTTPGFGGF